MISVNLGKENKKTGVIFEKEAKDRIFWPFSPISGIHLHAAMKIFNKKKKYESQVAKRGMESAHFTMPRCGVFCFTDCATKPCVLTTNIS